MAAEGAKLATGWLELTVSTRGAQSQIQKDVVPGATAAGDQAGTSLGAQLLGGLKKFAGPIAVLVAGFSVGKLVKDSTAAFTELAGATNALQRIAGGTKEEVSGLRGAMQLSGVDADKATGALTIFSKNLGNAAADGDKAAEMASKLGTNFLDAAGQVKPMSEILPGLADKFKSMPDGAEKTALAAQLFGRSGAQMLPFLNKGSEGIGQLTDKARQMGLVIDDTAAKSLSAAKVSQREYNMSVQGLMVTLGGGLLPVMTSVQNLFRSGMIPVIQAATGFLARHRDAFLSVSDAIQGFADRIGGAVTGLIALVTQGDYTSGLGKALGISEDSPIIGALFTIRSGVIDAFGAISAAGGQVFAAVAPAFTALGPVIAGLLPQLLQLYTSLSPTSLIFQSLMPVLPTIVQLATTLGQALGGLLTTALSTLLPPVLQLAQTLSGVLTTAIQMLVPIVLQLVQSGLSTFVSIITTIVPIAAQLATVLGGVLGQAITSLMPVVTQIVALLGGVLTQAISTLLPVFLQLVPIIGQIAGVLGGVLGTVIQALVPIISLIATVLGQVLTAVMPLITAVFQLITPILGLISPILSLIAPLLQLVGSILSPLIQLFTSLLTPILSLITPIIGLLVPVLQFLVTILSFVIQGVVDVLTWIVQLVTGSGDAGSQLATVWNNTMGMFADFFTNTVGMFVDFFNNTVGMVSDFGARLSLGFQIIWTNVTAFFANGVNGIIGFFTALPGQVMDAISGLGGMLFDAAQSILQSFLDGFNSMFSAISDTVGGVMDFVGSFFPHSPAKRGPLAGSGWTAIGDAGRAIVGQFATGVKVATPGAEAALAAVVGSAALTSPGGRASGAAGAAGTATERVRETIQVLIDKKQLGEALREYERTKK